MSENLPLRYYVGRGLEELILKSTTLGSVYYRIAPGFYEWKYQRRIPDRFDAPLTIFKCIEVNPDEIEYVSSRDSLTTGAERRLNIGKICGGYWDINPKCHIENEDISVYQAIFNHFVNNVPWFETELYEWAINEIEQNGDLWHNCQSISDLNQRFGEIEKLYDNIRTSGYKTQSELNKPPIDFVNMYLNEICVDIGRRGRLFLVDGRHRLSIAKILDLNKIPVFPVVRHKEWMTRRDQTWENLKSEESIHPDISDTT